MQADLHVVAVIAFYYFNLFPLLEIKKWSRFIVPWTECFCNHKPHPSLQVLWNASDLTQEWYIQGSKIPPNYSLPYKHQVLSKLTILSWYTSWAAVRFQLLVGKLQQVIEKIYSCHKLCTENVYQWDIFGHMFLLLNDIHHNPILPAQEWVLKMSCHIFSSSITYLQLLQWKRT